MPSYKKMLCLLVLAAALVSGCATSKTSVNEKILLWPTFPEEPRFRYLKSYQGEADFAAIGFWDRIFGGPALQGLSRPNSVYARGDKLYVSLPAKSSIALIDIAAKKVTYDIGAYGPGKLSMPMCITGTADGLILVSDAKARKIYGYNEKGDLVIAFGKSGELVNPVGIAVNNELQRLYVADSQGHKVNVYSLSGKLLFTFGKAGYGDGEFMFPSSLAIQNATGNLYVVDTQNFRIQVFDKDGKFLSKFGDVGDRPGSFARPKAIAIDSENNVYVVDTAFDNFQVFNAKNEILFFLGTGGFGPGQFHLPNGIHIDEQDRVYVVDSVNNRIQVFQYLSERWKKEHPEEYTKYFLPPGKM